MNTALLRWGGSLLVLPTLPAVQSPTTRGTRTALLLRFRFPQHRTLTQSPGILSPPYYRGKAWVQDFAFCCRLVDHLVPNRVHLCYRPAVHLRLLSTAALLRRSYLRSQAGKHDLTRTFTSQCWPLHRRTSIGILACAPLTGERQQAANIPPLTSQNPAQRRKWVSRIDIFEGMESKMLVCRAS